MPIRFMTKKYTEGEKLLLKNLISSPKLKYLNKSDIVTLFNRGLTTIEAIDFNIKGTINDLTSIRFKDESLLTQRLLIAMRDKEVVVVMGDYDADGCLGTTIAYKALKRLGINVHYYMNSRFIDGYGLRSGSVDEILKSFGDVKVILTVDNGISAFSGIDYASSLGIDVLVTDHHEVPENLPTAYAIVNPKRKDCMFPFKGLCGAGVVFMIFRHLYAELGFGTSFIDEMSDLAAMATVGDHVPLIDDNRIIVKDGLKLINSKNRLPLKMLCERTEKLYVDSNTLAYYFVPMINALSRLHGNNLDVIRLLCSENSDEINEIIDLMISTNESRKSMSEVQLAKAMTLVDDDNLPSVIVIYDSSFTEGIIGLTAIGLLEKFNRPTIVLCDSEDPDVLKGSARALEGMDIKGIFNCMCSLFISYGGHKGAAGLSIYRWNLDKLVTDINLCLPNIDTFLDKEVIIDSVIVPLELDVDLCKSVNSLEPFGVGFSKPMYMLKDFEVDWSNTINNKSNSPYVGNLGRMIRLVNSNRVTVIGFTSAKKYKKLGEPRKLNVLGYPELNTFNNKTYAQFVISKDYIMKVK